MGFSLNKAWIIRIGLVFLILSFFIGFFWPIIFTPTPEEAGVSPTATPQLLPAFTASSNATARVVKLENRLILFCQGVEESSLQSLAQALKQMQGVERVLVGASVFDVFLSSNSTALASVVELFSGACPAGNAFRKASELSFSSTVTLTPPQGFEPITTRLPPTLCKQPNWSCLVGAGTQENASISVVVTLNRLEDDGSEQGVVQEVAREENSTTSTLSQNSS